MAENKHDSKNNNNNEPNANPSLQTPQGGVEQEWLLVDNPNRFVMFPIQYPAFWKMVNTHTTHQAGQWQRRSTQQS